jgi:hypothetical protein
VAPTGNRRVSRIVSLFKSCGPVAHRQNPFFGYVLSCWKEELDHSFGQGKRLRCRPILREELLSDSMAFVV